MVAGIARLRLLVPYVVVAVGWIVPAPAQTCADLEARLAATAARGDPRQATRYEHAIATQRAELAKAREKARRARCGFSVPQERVAQCASLNDMIDRMERNLLDLRSQRDEATADNPGRERGRLLAAIEANGCRESEARRLPGAIDGGTGRDGSARTLNEGLRLRSLEDESLRRIIHGSGGRQDERSPASYRTMCVRTCDGYYFPISYSVPPSRFTRDEQACQARCRGTDVALYAHRVPGEEPDDMISVNSGEPYRALPTAFDHRDPDIARPRGCGCDPPGNFSIIAGEAPPDDAGAVEPDERAAVEPIPRPRPRPDPAADPQTRADRAGGLDPDTISRILGSREAVSADGGGRGIRVVGPTFLPDPEEAIELRAPVRTPDR